MRTRDFLVSAFALCCGLSLQSLAADNRPAVLSCGYAPHADYVVKPLRAMGVEVGTCAHGKLAEATAGNKYHVLVEEDWRGKNLLYRWTPSASRGTGAAGSAPATAVREESFLSLLSDDALPHWRQCGPGRFVVTNGVATGEGGMGLWWYAGRQ